MKRKARHYKQSAVIPYRKREDGTPEILLITSMSAGKWIIPKGHLEGGMTPAESAEKEAFEEGGVVGKVSSTAVGSFVYEKRGAHYEVETFPLLVEVVLDTWDEQEYRSRAWFPIQEAIQTAQRKGIREVLDVFRQQWEQGLY